MSSITTSASSSAPTVTPTATASTQSSGPQNSPLLFFVALGFGVVFTNLWIIVGVKYCFRYNARNRARQQGEDGEPIDLAAMPQHRRRRREKKLMTMDEVNERFPITKYKAWVSSRAAQGLSTEGGVSQSRAASIKDAEGVIAPIESTSSSAAGKEAFTVEATQVPASTPPTTIPGHGPSSSSHPEPATDAAEEDEEGIPAAVPGASEMLEAPGDSCAICIDTLDDDDDVRGLTCGHAFHASCLDPWLTSRRACCPLCKADYYVPKPRPENSGDLAQEMNGNEPADQVGAEGAEPQRPSLAASIPAGGISRYIPRFVGGVEPLPPVRVNRSRSRARQSPSNNAVRPQQRTQGMSTRFAGMFGRNRGTASTSRQPVASQPEGQIDSSHWRAAFPGWRRGDTSTTQAQTTPGELEAGNNPSTTTTV